MSIISIAHLSDCERMFFVTVLLNEIVAWMRSQAGTSSLRALLYMDEVFGYFPPTANPPSKRPMLTLMKQARAFGLGVVLATQNPVDLDYKGLSNAGTWFLGRLQTERDKLRVLEGLEGASAAAGSTFHRARMEATLAGLGNRVFIMNNVHDDAPVVFQTRWALSYLRGPLSRDQISSLMAAKKQAKAESGASASESLTTGETPGQRPVIPPGIEEIFIASRRDPRGGERLIYRPAVMGAARVHFVKSSNDIDAWETVTLMSVIGGEVPDDIWAEARSIDYDLDFEANPHADAVFGELPSAMSQPKQYTSWKTSLKNHLYRSHSLVLYACPILKLKSQAGEAEGEFRIRVKQAASEQRDLEIEKLRKKYTPKLKSLEERLRKAEQKVKVQKNQVTQQTWSTVASVGTTILGALFGRKLTSATNVGRAATSMRSAGKIAHKRSDVARAEDTVETLQEQLVALEEEFTRESEKLCEQLTGDALELKELPIKPRKSDLTVDQVALVWTPWILDAVGMAQPAFGE
jgi:hypothetical protein